jgi:hypothetical protein
MLRGARRSGILAPAISAQTADENAHGAALSTNAHLWFGPLHVFTTGTRERLD